NAAAPDDIIIVADGTYNENVNINTMGTPGDITIQAQNPGGATIDGGAAAAITANTFSGAIHIEGFQLDANTGIANGVITMLNVSGRLSVINNTFVAGYGGTAIYVLNTASASTLVSVLDNNASGAVDNDDFLFVQVGENQTGGGDTDIVVDGNVISGLEDHGVQVDLEGFNYTATIRISDNNMSNWAAGGNGVVVNLGGGSPVGTNIEAYVAIENNSITQPDGSAIFLNADGDNTSLYVTVSNNTLTGNANSSYGISLDDDSSSNGVTVNASFLNNTISNFPNSGIWIRPFADDVNRNVWNLVIDGNNISNIDTDLNGAGDEAAIEIPDNSGEDDENYTINVEITNNTFSSIP
ncbi:MAG: hypothetical protein AAFN81_35475, partial [Bacteroidota bacterium]